MVAVGIMVLLALGWGIKASPPLLYTLAVLLLILLASSLFAGVLIGLFKAVQSETAANALWWFCTSHKFGVVYPWSVTLVALAGIGCLTLGVGTTGKVLLTFLATIAIVVGLILASLAVMGVGYGSLWLVKKGWRLLFSFRHPSQVRLVYSKGTVVPPEKGMSTFGLVVRAVWAQHNRICPLVELPDQENTKSW